MQLQKSCSLKTTISKLSISQLNKLSKEVEQHFQQNPNQKKFNTWQKLIRKEIRTKQSTKNNKIKKRKGIILIKGV